MPTVSRAAPRFRTNRIGIPYFNIWKTSAYRHPTSEIQHFKNSGTSRPIVASFVEIHLIAMNRHAMALNDYYLKCIAIEGSLIAINCY